MKTNLTKSKIEMAKLKQQLVFMSEEQLEDLLFEHIEALDLLNIDRETENKAPKPTTTKIGMIYRKLMQSTRFDYIRNDHIYGAIENSGSIMEYLIARDIKELENHMVTNKKGIDIQNGRWDYEIKSFTNNSACHGYSTIEKWNDVIDNKIMVLAFENVVYQPTKAQMKKIFPLLKLKTDKNKKGKIELRIAGNKKIIR